MKTVGLTADPLRTKMRPHGAINERLSTAPAELVLLLAVVGIKGRQPVL